MLTNLMCWALCLAVSLGPTWRVLAAEPVKAPEQSDASDSTDSPDQRAERSDQFNRPDDDTEPPASPNTVIAKGFLLHLNCDQDRKLNGNFRVAMDGRVHLPYSVVLPAAGQKVSSFESKLVSAFPFFKSTPHITVTIREKRYWVKILGLVKKPGTYLLRDNTTLEEALSLASVRTEDLAVGYARINQGDHWHNVSMEDYLKQEKTARNLPPWQGGDRIFFQLERPEGDSGGTEEASGGEADTPSTRKIQVTGDVRTPGGVSFQHHTDAYYYLIQRGGPTPTSDLDRVEVLRTNHKNGTHTQISLGNINEIKSLQESDILLVHSVHPTNFDHTLQNAALIGGILSAIALTVVVFRNTK